MILKKITLMPQEHVQQLVLLFLEPPHSNFNSNLLLLLLVVVVAVVVEVVCLIDSFILLTAFAPFVFSNRRIISKYIRKAIFRFDDPSGLPMRFNSG